MARVPAYTLIPRRTRAIRIQTIPTRNRGRGGGAAPRGAGDSCGIGDPARVLAPNARDGATSDGSRPRRWLLHRTVRSLCPWLDNRDAPAGAARTANLLSSAAGRLLNR